MRAARGAGRARGDAHLQDERAAAAAGRRGRDVGERGEVASGGAVAEGAAVVLRGDLEAPLDLVAFHRRRRRMVILQVQRGFHGSCSALPVPRRPRWLTKHRR